MKQILFCLFSLLPLSLLAQISITESQDEGMTAFKIVTKSATYFYQVEAGGFSSIVDQYGNDWVNFTTKPKGKGTGLGLSVVHGIVEDHGGTITVRTFYEHSFRLRRSDGQGKLLPLQIEITDDGPGLPDNIRDDIFEPFVSGKENGTGLGLALVSKIIADHNGWISVRSEPGQTTVRLSLSRVPREPN